MNTEQIEALKALAEAASDKPVLSPDGVAYFDTVTPAVILELLASSAASAARIADLERANENMQQCLQEQSELVGALTRESGRYRWLREKAILQSCDAAPIVLMVDDNLTPQGENCGMLSGLKLDAAIDAAMQAKEPT